MNVLQFFRELDNTAVTAFKPKNQEILHNIGRQIENILRSKSMY